MKKSEAKHVYKLIKEWTRAEIMARIAARLPRDYADYFKAKLEKEDELRKFIFGTSNLLELGTRWKLIRKRKKKK